MSEDKGYGFITLNFYESKPNPWSRPESRLRASFGKALDEGGDVKQVVDELRDQLDARLETENKASELPPYDEWLTEL